VTWRSTLVLTGIAAGTTSAIAALSASMGWTALSPALHCRRPACPLPRRSKRGVTVRARCTSCRWGSPRLTYVSASGGSARCSWRRPHGGVAPRASRVGAWAAPMGDGVAYRHQLAGEWECSARSRLGERAIEAHAFRPTQCVQAMHDRIIGETDAARTLTRHRDVLSPRRDAADPAVCFQRVASNWSQPATA